MKRSRLSRQCTSTRNTRTLVRGPPFFFFFLGQLGGEVYLSAPFQKVGVCDDPLKRILLKRANGVEKQYRFYCRRKLLPKGPKVQSFTFLFEPSTYLVGGLGFNHFAFSILFSDDLHYKKSCFQLQTTNQMDERSKLSRWDSCDPHQAMSATLGLSTTTGLRDKQLDPLLYGDINITQLSA